MKRECPIHGPADHIGNECWDCFFEDFHTLKDRVALRESEYE
jgi:hypothetical protein